MLKLNSDDVIALWEADCIIDTTNIEEEISRTPRMHAKYLEIRTNCKREKTQIEEEAKKIYVRLTRYYSGKMNKKELDAYGWDQFQESKPLKGEMEKLIATHPSFVELGKRQEELDLMIFNTDSILKLLYSRGFDMRNIIENRKFEAGC